MHLLNELASRATIEDTFRHHKKKNFWSITFRSFVYVRSIAVIVSAFARFSQREVTVAFISDSHRVCEYLVEQKPAERAVDLVVLV